MGIGHIKYKFIDNSSKYYRQMIDLRYKAFFQKLNLERDIVLDNREDGSLHIIALEGEKVIGCGRLSLTPEEIQISQIAVEESMTGRGIGSSIMERLLFKAEEQGAQTIYLDARVESQEFYVALGFQSIGSPFPSKKTGIPHIKMEKQLKSRNA